VLSLTRVPLGYALAGAIRLIRPLAGPVIDAYAALQPRGDKELLARPEFRAMFLDDLLNGARFHVGAPLADVILFTRHWGFEAADVTVPVHWWHGDGDHIIPHAHGVHMAARLPDCRFETIPGESHLGGMGVATEVLRELMDLGPRKSAAGRRAGAPRR
jgi:pimeloyl-ACP methyl ester carboxylesterase